MFVRILQSCKTEYGIFHQGELREVSSPVAAKLAEHGWSEAATPLDIEKGSTPAAANVVLEVDNATLGVAASEV